MLVPLNLVGLLNVSVAALCAPPLVVSEEFRSALRTIAVNWLANLTLFTSDNKIPCEWVRKSLQQTPLSGCGSRGTMFAADFGRCKTMFDRATFASHSASGEPKTNRRIQGTALVVEDHSDFRELLSFVLKSIGYNVLQAKNGHDALRLAATRRVDLLVTDLGLPEMDGLKLVHLVRAFNPDHRDLKIVMLTAYDVRDYEPKALAAGCDVVLSKPVDIQKFERVVRSLQGDFESGPSADESATQPHAAIHHDNTATRHTNATMY